jgi:hypothetical protein
MKLFYLLIFILPLISIANEPSKSLHKPEEVARILLQSLASKDLETIGLYCPICLEDKRYIEGL